MFVLVRVLVLVLVIGIGGERTFDTDCDHDYEHDLDTEHAHEHEHEQTVSTLTGHWPGLFMKIQPQRHEATKCLWRPVRGHLEVRGTRPSNWGAAGSTPCLSARR